MTPEEKILILLSNYFLSVEHLSSLTELLAQNPDWAKLIAPIRFHSLSPLIVKHISENNLQNNLPSSSWDKTLGFARTQTVRRLKLIAVFQELSAIFKENNIEFILLKGLYLSDNFYSNPTLRPMQDIDILVKEETLSRVITILESSGATRLVELQSEYINSLLQHIPPFIYKDVMLEVHTNIVAANLPYSFTPDLLWSNISNHQIQKTNTLVFNPELNLVYLCIHLFRHLRTAKFKLIWFTDILQFLSKTTSLDYAVLKSLAAETRSDEAIGQIFFFLQNFWNQKTIADFPIPIIEPDERILRNFQNGLLRGQNPDEFSNFEAWKQIPGIFNKLRYLSGIAFPSSAYMKKKYSLSSSLLLIPIYPFNALKVCFKGVKLLISR